MDSRNMKRVRGDPGNEASPTKKGKVEERKDRDEEVVAVEETAELEVGLWSRVDEEMSWATWWFPFWEVEAVEDAYNALYGDVYWGYDIWGFKSCGNP